MKKHLLSGLFSVAVSLLLFWGCTKETDIAPETDLQEATQQVAAWYRRQLIPTDNPAAFAQVNRPDWGSTIVERRGDSVLYTTHILQGEKISRELHVVQYDGAYFGLVRQYEAHGADTVVVGTFTVNGRLIDAGYFDGRGHYTLTALAGDRNIVLMGEETVDGGTLAIRKMQTDPIRFILGEWTG